MSTASVCKESDMPAHGLSMGLLSASPGDLHDSSGDGLSVYRLFVNHAGR